ADKWRLAWLQDVYGRAAALEYLGDEVNDANVDVAVPRRGTVARAAVLTAAARQPQGRHEHGGAHGGQRSPVAVIRGPRRGHRPSPPARRSPRTRGSARRSSRPRAGPPGPAA